MAHAEHAGSHVGHHIIPKKTLLTVFGALIGLTILTVVTAQIDLGALNIPVALAIAITKAALVVLFFMALKYDTPVNSLVFIVGSIFVVVFLTFTLSDTIYRGDLGNVDRATIRERALMKQALEAGEPVPPSLERLGPPGQFTPGESSFLRWKTNVPAEVVQGEAADAIEEADVEQDLQETIDAETPAGQETGEEVPEEQ